MVFRSKSIPTISPPFFPVFSLDDLCSLSPVYRGLEHPTASSADAEITCLFILCVYNAWEVSLYVPVHAGTTCHKAQVEVRRQSRVSALAFHLDMRSFCSLLCTLVQLARELSGTLPSLSTTLGHYHVQLYVDSGDLNSGLTCAKQGSTH